MLRFVGKCYCSGFAGSSAASLSAKISGDRYCGPRSVSKKVCGRADFFVRVW